MTDRTLYCNTCHTTLAVIRDGKIKKGMVCYCKECEAIRNLQCNKTKVDMPDFLKDIFKT